MGTECHYFICDVGNREEVYQTAKAVREKVSGLEGSVCTLLARLHPGECQPKRSITPGLGKSIAHGRMAVSRASLGTLLGSRPLLCVRECVCACECYSGQG